MATWVVDKSLDVLLRQINEIAPGRDKSSDGSIGDADHQARESAHNPERTWESSDGNDPDYQVDARDFTHDPDSGADMHVIGEQLRVSRDRRIYLVIFDGQQFSSYSRDGYAPFTWRPYYGENKHRHHLHAETNDKYNDDLTPWKVYKVADSPAVTSTEWRLWYYLQLTESGTNPATDKVEKYPAVTLLKRVDAATILHSSQLSGLQRQVSALTDLVLILDDKLNRVLAEIDALEVPNPAPVDPTTLQPVVENGVRAVLRNGVDQA